MNGPVPTSKRVPLRRSILLPGIVTLVGLFLLAWRFYLERTACFDSAFFSWMMIDAQEPFSALGRYGSWVGQLLPLALVHFGAPLELVLRSYSVSFVLFHALIFVIVAFVLRDERAAVALPITLVTAFHYMFYYGISELYQGMALVLLMWPLYRRLGGATTRRGRIGLGVLLVLLAVITSFYHQLLVLPLIFMLVYGALTDDRMRRRPVIIVAALAVAWFVIKITLLSSSTYEQERMPSLSDLLTYAMRLHELPSTHHLVSVWPKFKSAIVLVLATLVLLIAARKWAVLAWLVLFSCGFLTLALITDRDGGSPTIFENYYPLLGLFWAVVFADTWFGRASIPRPKLRTAVLCAVLVLGLFQIHRGHHRISFKVEYTARITAFLHEHGIRKAYAEMGNYPWTYCLGNWPLGMETALVSGTRGPAEVTTCFITADTVEAVATMDRPNAFLGPAWAVNWFSSNLLDQRYFELPASGYVRTNTVGPDSLWAYLGDRQVVLHPPEPTTLVHDRFTVVLLPVTMNGAMKLPSRCTDGSAVRFVSELLREDGSVYGGIEGCALETDIPAGATYPQGLVIERPVDPGTYRVRTVLTARERPISAPVEFTVVAGRFGL